MTSRHYFLTRTAFVVAVLFIRISALDNQVFQDDRRADSNYCICKECSEKSFNIECHGKLVVREVQGFINRICSGSDIYDLSLKLSTSTAVIPANLLDGKRARRIFIYCNSSTATKLHINPNAFRTSSYFTETFRILNCDLSQQKDFLFLSDFEKLHSVSMQNSYAIEAFNEFPLLPSIKQIVIYNCTGLENFTGFPLNALAGGLKELDLALNSLDDDKAESIIGSLIISPAARTLEVLRLSSNKLTRIPRNSLLSPLIRLNQFFLDGNNISTIGRNSLAFMTAMTNLTLINLMDAGVNSLERGSLDYVLAKIQLDVNNIKKLKKSVFKKMLEMSHKYAKGGLSITSNPLDCQDCSLAWLIRDNQHLLEYVQGNCGDNQTTVVAFEDLNSSDYEACQEEAEFDERPSSYSWFYYFVLKLIGTN